jgi:hypothetical protein
MYSSVITVFALLHICMVLNTVYANYGESMYHLSLYAGRNVLGCHTELGVVSDNVLIIQRETGTIGNERVSGKVLVS